jgi:prolyl 4-hydroxylase
MQFGDLSYYIRSYDHNLEASFCERLVASFNGLARFQKQNGRGVRAGLEQSAWTELNVSRFSDAEFLALFRRYIDTALDRYNRDLGLTIALPNTPLLSDLVMKRYRAGQAEQFQLHFDAVNHVANRYLVMMWYLNDVADGGETSFPQLGIKVAARAGRLLVFPPYWMYQHAGIAPVSGDKYIVSTYLLFEMPQVS